MKEKDKKRRKREPPKSSNQNNCQKPFEQKNTTSLSSQLSVWVEGLSGDCSVEPLISLAQTAAFTVLVWLPLCVFGCVWTELTIGDERRADESWSWSGKTCALCELKIAWLTKASLNPDLEWTDICACACVFGVSYVAALPALNFSLWSPVTWGGSSRWDVIPSRAGGEIERTGRGSCLCELLSLVRYHGH